MVYIYKNPTIFEATSLLVLVAVSAFTVCHTWIVDLQKNVKTCLWYRITGRE